MEDVIIIIATLVLIGLVSFILMRFLKRAQKTVYRKFGPETAENDDNKNFKWDLSKTNLSFTVKKQYTRDELLTFLKENNAEKEIGPLEPQKVIVTGEIIVAEGVDGYVNYIYPRKNKIVISQIRQTVKGRIADLAASAATDGWSTLLGTRGIKGNAAVAEMIAETIQKLAP